MNKNCRSALPRCVMRSRSCAIKTVVSGLLLAITPQVHALNWELENGVTVDLDTSITYDAQWRQEKQNATLLAFNGQGPLVDDGNKAFDKGDMTQNRVSFSSDLDINYGDGGVFLRGRGWYDEIYDTDATKSFQQDGFDLHASEIELLDAFVYHTFDFEERSASVRLGKQVVNWGESLFLYGGISSAQAPLDVTKANAPGVELKDIFMPLGQANVQFDLTDKLSMSAYYQYDWESHRIDAPGTFFGWDFMGQGSTGDTLDVPFPSTVLENKPDAGQYGIAVYYLAEELNNTEFGLYYLRYNDFINSVRFLPPAFGPQLTNEFFEDINLIGLSFGTVFGDTNVSGEVSYRDGQPVQLGQGPTAGFYFSEAETLQAQISIIHLLGDTPIADNLALVGELGYNRVLSIDSDATAAGLGIDVSNVSAALNEDRSAAGAIISLSADYYALAEGLDLKVTGTYRNDFDGVSAVPLTFAKGLEQFSLKGDFNYLNNHSFGVSYVWNLTDPDEVTADIGRLELGHLQADKDYLAAYYKYRF
ncbi:conserved hypothetical protein [Amphritea japonica ATCC BAA-1530]|uniref:DUF1302 domain-containing protein n=3 Tax=Amphritea TaxID=515417 RepID=A0A7R6P4N7_9GAMM|nr:conserved hypothetical protein [Amphritea japonica ATCC BAA-1530]